MSMLMMTPTDLGCQQCKALPLNAPLSIEASRKKKKGHSDKGGVPLSVCSVSFGLTVRFRPLQARPLG